MKTAKRKSKRMKRVSSYVTRPSQITKRAPSKRLKKRRVKNINKSVKERFSNPEKQSRPLLFIITAKKGAGKKMHFDGKNFSQRTRVRTFKTMAEADTKAQSLLRQYPLLRKYNVMIESNNIGRIPPSFR